MTDEHRWHGRRMTGPVVEKLTATIPAWVKVARPDAEWATHAYVFADGVHDVAPVLAEATAELAGRKFKAWALLDTGTPGLPPCVVVVTIGESGAVDVLETAGEWVGAPRWRWALKPGQLVENCARDWARSILARDAPEEWERMK